MALQPKIAGSGPGPSGHTVPAVAPGQRQRVCTAPNLRDRSEESVELASPHYSEKLRFLRCFGAEVPVPVVRILQYPRSTVEYRPIALQRSGVGTVAAFAATLFSPTINFHILL